MSHSDTAIPQDYLGDLNEKTMQELQELLLRQERLLKNVKFIAKLPDKGSKIKNMVARLQSLMQSRKEVDDTTDLFEKMALEATQARRVPDLHEEEEFNPLRQMANRSNDKVLVDERTENQPPNKFINSYEKVIRKAELRQVSQKPKFFPNRSVKHKDISELPVENLAKLKIQESSKKPKDFDPTANPFALPTKLAESIASTQSDSTETLSPNSSLNDLPKSPANNEHDEQSKAAASPSATSHRVRTLSNSKLKHNYDESLMASDLWHSPSHGPAKMISIEESISVLKQQQKKQEVLQAQQAAERLVQRLHITMKAFDPEGSRGTLYRDVAAAESDEEDSDDAEPDYPDED